MKAVIFASGLAGGLLVGGGAGYFAGGRDAAPTPGSTEILRTEIQSAPGLELIVSDVSIGPGGAIPKHTHQGEEIVYILDGAVVHVEAGKEDETHSAGAGYVIPPETAHAPRGGAQGARAVTVRLLPKGAPERTPVE